MYWILLVTAALAGTPHALLVGVSDYSYDPRWVNLGSTRDLALLQDALQKRGVNDVRVVANAGATREGVLAAITTLTEDVAVGDHVLLHWSGHGQQLADDNGDELDGLDEAMVVYGALQAGDGYGGEKHLRDDDLGEALRPLRLRLGPTGSLAVVLDACHSGTGTRADLPGRGGAPPIGTHHARSPSRTDSPGFADLEDDGELAPQVSVYAARADQLAREAYGPDGRSVGALSLALATALASRRHLETWRGVFEQARGDMVRTVPGQEPQLEGSRDLRLFGGQIAHMPRSFVVASVTGPTSVRIQAGQLYGWTVGTTVSFHPPGTPAPTRAGRWTTGRVSEVRATDAVVILDATTSEDLAAARVFVDAWGTGSAVLRVGVAVSGQVGRRWRAAIAEVPLVTVDDATPQLIVEQRGDAMRLVRYTDRDTPLATDDSGLPTAGSPLLDRIRTMALGELILDVDLTNGRRQVALELVPVARCDGSAPIGPPTTQVRPGQHVAIIARNTGTEPSYLSVVYLEVGGGVRALALRGGNLPERLAPGIEKRLQCQLVVPGSGREVLKAFATADPVDFGPLLHQRSRTRGAASSTLQRLIDERSRGTRALVDADTLESGFSVELVFETVEAS